MNWSEFITVVGTGISVMGFIYMIIRNFKNDIHSMIDRVEKRIDKMEERIDGLEERMFLLATGKSLADAIKEERLKKEKA